MSELQEVQERIAERRVARRKFLVQAGAGAAGLGLATVGARSVGAQEMTTQGAKKVKFTNPNDRFRVTDRDILQFSLNLEYLEAEFYVHAAFGRSLADADITGVAGFNTRRQNNDDTIAPGAVEGGRKVDFQGNTVLEGLAQEIATDEESHVRAFRGILGRKAVARPAINIGSAFTNAAAAAGLGNGFDAYANSSNFLLAAFIFEDVGVTAFKGAAPFIQNSDVLSAAAGVLAVEAYHAGAIRTLLLLGGTLGIGGDAPNPDFIAAAQAISNLRDRADGQGEDKDQGILNDPNGQTRVNVVPTDANGIAFGRTFIELLSIVYLTGPVGIGGGFFPNGLNSRIR